MIVSDHAPHLLEEKQDDFEYAPTGTPGVETIVPLMLQLVRENHLAIDVVLGRLCERPGEIYGIKKGKIEPGYDADLMVVDMLAGEYIKADNMHSKCGWTAYEGMPGIFPKAVFLRGELMVENRNRIAQEREGLIEQLKQTLSEVKTLRGFLPICSTCKKVRGDQGYWQQIESYLREHTETEFSHSLCPDCAQRLYPEQWEKIQKKAGSNRG